MDGVDVKVDVDGVDVKVVGAEEKSEEVLLSNEPKSVEELSNEPKSDDATGTTLVDVDDGGVVDETGIVMADIEPLEKLEVSIPNDVDT